MAIGLTKFSSLINFCLDWRILLMRRQIKEPSTIIGSKQLASNASQKYFSTNNIKSLKINYIDYNDKVNNQFQFHQHQIKNFLFSTLLKCYKWLNKIIYKFYKSYK
jgi:hypothetical protein